MERQMEEHQFWVRIWAMVIPAVVLCIGGISSCTAYKVDKKDGALRACIASGAAPNDCAMAVQQVVHE